MARASDVIAALDLEADAIIAGNYAALADLGARRTAKIETLDMGQLTEAELKELSVRLRAVQDMTGAALNGLRSARARVAEGVAARDRLASYGPDGASLTITRPKADLSRRA